MPATLSYPGVYIEEVPSQVRTIVGVATSITAFVGRARKGPINDPTRIFNYGDFERNFGGLWMPSTLSYSVQHYFQNGGADAIIVRLVDEDGETATEQLDSLRIAAASRGDWGNRIRAEVSVSNSDATLTLQEIAAGGTLQDFVVLNQAEVTGSGGDSVDTDTPLAHVSGALPSSAAGPIFLTQGDNPARPATVRLPVTTETLTLQDNRSGSPSEALRATVVHSTSDSKRFALIITDPSTDPSTVTEYGNLTAGDLASQLSSSDPIAVSGSEPDTRPAQIEDVEFSDPSAGTSQLELMAITAALELRAANAGAWGDNLEAEIDHDTADNAPSDTFNLVVQERDEQGNVVASETLRNLVLAEDAPRYIEKVLEAESDLVRVVTPLPADRPQETTAPRNFIGGDDGGELEETDYLGSRADKTGIYALEDADLFNMLCIPPITRMTDVSATLWSRALAYCKEERAMLIVDPPSNWNEPADVTSGSTGVDSLNLRDENAAIYFPRVRMADPLRENRLETFAPCGVVAGVIARTDAERGVWKAPAGIETTLMGVQELTYKLTDRENGQLNPIGVNALRTLPIIGHVSWGARTLRGADRLASQWKYLPVRRLALFIEETLYRGTQWVVFEPNDETLWSQIRLNVGAFMQNLFRQGAFQGTSPRQAYLVKCDSETTTQNDINRGIVNVVVGFAPLKPAEFVVIKIQQLAGRDQG